MLVPGERWERLEEVKHRLKDEDNVDWWIIITHAGTDASVADKLA